MGIISCRCLKLPPKGFRMDYESLTTNNGLAIEGPLLLKPKVFGDDRGFFFESWNSSLWHKLLLQNGQQPEFFVQDNHSRSTQGVLRGLHYQANPHPQAKLVRCVVGEIYDVAVDLRIHSSTFGKWVGANLSDKNCLQLWIPIGFAHGFLTLSETAEVLYKTTDFWSPHCERSIRWDDDVLDISWPIQSLHEMSPKVSKKDGKGALFSELDKGELFL